MKPILLFGATGFTGGLTLDALGRRDLPCIIVGRSSAPLELLKHSLPHVLDARTADALDPESLRAAFSGAGVVISTVGPFEKLGRPVLRAAVNAGAHYIDSTAEQAFARMALENFHHRARQRNLTLLTGHACDFSFSYAGAARLASELGPLKECHTYLSLDGFTASVGTAQSALGMLHAPYWTFLEGRFQPQPASRKPTPLTFPGDAEPSYTVPFPGGEVVLLPSDMPSLETCTAHLVLPKPQAKGFARFNSARQALTRVTSPGLLGLLERALSSRVNAHVTNPTPENRAATRWRLIVHGKTANREGCCVITGPDPYGISAETLSLAAGWLAEGRAKKAGVVTTGAAFCPKEFLQAMSPFGVHSEVIQAAPTPDSAPLISNWTKG